MSTDAQLRAQAKYDRNNTRTVIMKLNVSSDADILAKLDQVENKQGYIKDLIRRDIRGDESVLPMDSLKLMMKSFGKRYKLNRVYLFGSYARGEATSESDLDLLVDGKFKDMEQYLNAVRYLETMTGKNIDLVMESAAREDDSRSGRRFLEHVEKERVLIFDINEAIVL